MRLKCFKRLSTQGSVTELNLIPSLQEFSSSALNDSSAEDTLELFLLSFLTPEESQQSSDSADPVMRDTLVLNVNPTFKPGVFTVGKTGEVSIDFLFDGGGGKYQGELAIFSLDGMDNYELGSADFIQEAARRALSDSDLGHVVISDSVEKARFSGSLPFEGNFNTEEYLGVKTFSMNPGDEFGVMLVPNSTVEQVLDNPASASAVRPLFSMATANPDDAFQAGQIEDVTREGSTLDISENDPEILVQLGLRFNFWRCLFAFEDLRIDLGSDHDYNDMIFQVRGATGQVTRLDDAIDFSQARRITDMGQALFAFTQLYITPNDGGVIPENPPVIPTAPVDPIQFEFPQSAQPLVGVIDTSLSFAANNPDINYSRISLGQYRVDGDANPLLLPGEGNEHGTHVLGIIGATQDNNIGIDGANNRAPLWVGRAVGSGQWAESLVEFVDAAKASGQPHSVVNLSFDLTQVNPDGSMTVRYEFTPQEWAALEYAHQNGAIIVAATGNQGDAMSALSQAFQAFDNIITVGSAKNFDGFAFSEAWITPDTCSSEGMDLYTFKLVQEYCHIAKLPERTEQGENRLMEILELAESNAQLSFWISQADDFIDYELDLSDPKSEQNEYQQDGLMELLDRLEEENYGLTTCSVPNTLFV